MKWISVPIGELVELRQGFCVNRKSSHLIADSGLPLLRITDMINGSQTIFVKEDIPEKFIAKQDDIIFTRTGQVGLVFRNQYGVIHNNCFTVSPITKDLSKDYLYWFLRSDETKRIANDYASGAAQLDLSHGAFKNIRITFPSDIETQQKIASILSAYDDLIENNGKRIKLLEEKAFLKYKDIVQNNKLEKKKLKDILDLKYGKALKADERKDGKYPVYGSSGAVGFHEEFFVSGPGIIVGRKGNIGSVFWSDENFWPIDTVYYVESNLSLYFLYFNLKEQHFVNTDAAVPGLNRNFALDNWIHIPSERVLADFDLDAKPMFELNNILRKQNTRLRQARDLLLPRLMNGEISV